jgi:hypothetical protein
VTEPTQFPRRRDRAARADADDRVEQEGQPQRSQRGDGKSWAEWKRELSEAIELLDQACAEARQLIYKLRPLVRTRGEKSR